MREKEKGLTVHLAIDRGKLHQPFVGLTLEGLKFLLGRGSAELGLLKGLLEFPSLFYPELFFLGSALLKLSIAALRLFELGLQPEHLVLLFLELGLMRDCKILGNLHDARCKEV